MGLLEQYVLRNCNDSPSFDLIVNADCDYVPRSAHMYGAIRKPSWTAGIMLAVAGFFHVEPLAHNAPLIGNEEEYY